MSLGQEWVLGHKGKICALLVANGGAVKRGSISYQFSMGIFQWVWEKCQKGPNYCSVCTCCETFLTAKHFSFLHLDFFQNFQRTVLAV